jgi:hypothetical protein
VTAQDILTRASRALEAAADRARARDAEILRQRAAALANLPSGEGAREAAVKPRPTDDELEHDVAEKLSAAEGEAESKARAADDDALAKWQTADADAYAKYTRAVDDARGAFIGSIDTLHGAIHTVAGAEQARFIRDRAIAAAETEYRSARRADYEAYLRASTTAREQAIGAIERARLEAAAARRSLDAARGSGGLAASRDSTRASAASVTMAVAEAFDDQLARSRADAEREALAIASRLREELAGLGQPG